MNRLILALLLLFPFSSLKSEIAKFDEEDMRLLLASDPIALFTFPPIYAFSQGVQLAKENGYRYFSFIYYEGNFNQFKTVTHFKPKIGTGKVLKYEDRWMYLEIVGYTEPPKEREVFDVNHYRVLFYDDDIDDLKSE
ncbi:MAG: hypothetical protein JSS32_07690 [Verrucomicrobia bacterium]|nr:hypothetical protein [Verrucomicrobiota bacterium]